MTDIPTYHRGDRNFGTGYDMLKQIEALEDEIERLRAAPMVKPLEWVSSTFGFEAKSLAGKYEVYASIMAEHWLWRGERGIALDQYEGKEDGPDEAKAAAQADYERRIRAALTQEGKG